MPEMIWGNPVDKRLEAGVSKGILFLMDGTGVPWNGLQNVNVEVNGGETESLWYDGVKYLELAAAEDFQATILGLNSPDEFRACEGYNKLNPFAPGMYVPGTGYREKFNLVWRTEVGNQAEGFDYGYKLHIAYNCYVGPSPRQFATLGDAANPDQRSWTIRTTPACGRFSYYVFHSNEADLSALEDLLYNGTLPPCSELPQHVSEPGGETPPPDDTDCPKLITDFEEYLPGQSLDEDNIFGINEVFIYGKVSSGLDIWDLQADGAFVANDSDATETGTHPVLVDDDDATYVGSSAGDLGYTVKLPALFGYIPGAEIQLEIRMSVSGGVSADDPDNVDADAQIFITTDADGDLPVGGFSDGTDDGMSFAVEIVDGSIQDYVVPLNMDSWTDSSIDDVVSALEAGAYLNVVAVNNNNPDTTPDVKVYEAKISILDDTNPAKALRVITPDDSAWVEHHIYDAPGGDELIASVSTQVDFRVTQVPYNADVEGYTQQPTRWLMGGSDNDPGELRIDPNDAGTKPILEWFGEDGVTIYSDFGSLEIDLNVWYTVISDWNWDGCRIRVVVTDTQEVLKDVTEPDVGQPTCFVQHYAGMVGGTERTYEVMVDNAKMQVHCHEAGPVEYRLEPFGINDFDNGPTTYGDVWTDSDDATYAPVGYSDVPDSRGTLSQTEPTTASAYTGGAIQSLELHFRASCTGDSRDGLIVAQINRPGGSSRILWLKGNSSAGVTSHFNDGEPMEWVIPNDGIIRDYSMPIDEANLSENGWDSIDEIRADLATPGNYLYIWATDYYPHTAYPTSEIRIYEAWVIVKAES